MSSSGAPAPPAEDGRALRADAERNRRRILAAAAEVFAERGIDACTSEIARRAGVGTATLFRRFPSKDDLVLAIFEERMAALEAAAREGLGDPDPGAGLRSFLEAAARLQAEDLGFCQSVGTVIFGDPRARERHEQLLELSGRLLRAAQAAGAVRADLEPDDLPFLTQAATLSVQALGADPELHRRYLGLIFDGLSPSAATPLQPGAPDLAALLPRTPA